MFETSEQLITEDTSMQRDSDKPIIKEPSAEMENTHKLSSVSSRKLLPVSETPRSLPISYQKKTPGKKVLPQLLNKRDAANARMFQEQYRRLCLTLFASEQSTIRSLGFTSSIGGEGKSFLATVMARFLAHDSIEPVTLVECNWEHPTLHETFDIPATPGLAEWLDGTCSEDDVRYDAGENLTVIPAGDGIVDAVRLLKRIQQRGLQKLVKQNELFIFDLPPVITSSYGSLAASLVDTVILVVRSEVTPARMLAETCAQLNGVPIHGIILNQGNSHIPGWIRQIL